MIIPEMEFLGETLDVVGKLMVAYTAISVHHRVWKSHKIDKTVFAEMRNEQFLGILGIFLIIAGYFLRVYAKYLI